MDYAKSDIFLGCKLGVHGINVIEVCAICKESEAIICSLSMFLNNASTSWVVLARLTGVYFRKTHDSILEFIEATMQRVRDDTAGCWSRNGNYQS